MDSQLRKFPVSANMGFEWDIRQISQLVPFLTLLLVINFGRQI